LADIQQIVSLLSSAYGSPPRPESPEEPIDELVQTILSQHTSDINTARAFAALKARFPTWDAVIEATPDDVAHAIRSGGLARQKAPRIQRVLSEIKQERGNFDLTFLRELPLSDAVGWLTQFNGVGPKTAACVLLFSLDLPVMPVDTHVHRVAGRLGLINANATAEHAHGVLETGFSSDEVYEAHMLLIEHGRTICKARAPHCSECVLCELCPSAVNYLK
jgi:endonuclease III